MYKYALLVLKNELERLKKEQQDCVDRCPEGQNDLGTKLFSINTYQSSIFDLEDAIGILEDIAKDIEKERRE